jgi:ketosteroid isomerase-like protein
MPDESTTPDLVELTRRAFEALSSGDFGALTSFYAPDGVWDMSPVGAGVFVGWAATRGFLEDWQGAYEEFSAQPEEVADLGNGVLFVVSIQKGRPVGSSGEVELRYAAVIEWEDDKIKRRTTYTDIDEARAAAECLAKERG